MVPKMTKMTKSKARWGGARKNAGRPAKAQLPPLAPVDPDTIDPRRVLAGIAIDPGAPAGARVAACRALLDKRGGPEEDAEQVRQTDLARRAIKIMAGARRMN